MTPLELVALSLIAFILFAVFTALVIEWTGWGATRRKLRAIRRRALDMVEQGKHDPAQADYDALIRDAEAVRGDWEAILGKWDSGKE